MSKEFTIREKALMEAKQIVEQQEMLLKFSKKRFKKFDEIIMTIFQGGDLSVYFSDKKISKIHDCFTRFASKANFNGRVKLKDVFIYLEKNSALICDEEYIQAVFTMFGERAYWRKDIFEWKPHSKCVKRQMKDLATYLFCSYQPPEFLFSAFFEKDGSSYVNWFIHIGTGKKIKELPKVPIPFTQKTGHYFLLAPAKFSIQEALRWAQAKSMQADDRLAERITYSWIGTKLYSDELFWESLLRIVINGGMFNPDELGALIDYVRENRSGNGNYSLKGRTLQSLLRQSHEWHKKSVQIRGNVFWDPSGLYGYRLEKKEETIVMKELTGSKLLLNEGRIMKHCVASYLQQCTLKRTAIFSLRKYSVDILVDTMATIEVNIPIRRIVQAKAKMNRKISEEARKHLETWAHKNGLSISPHL